MEMKDNDGKFEDLRPSLTNFMEDVATLPRWLESAGNWIVSAGNGANRTFERIQEMERAIETTIPRLIEKNANFHVGYFPRLEKPDLRESELRTYDLVSQPRAETLDAECWGSPVLHLKPVANPEPKSGRVARLEGAGPYYDVSLDVPCRPFFWLFLLFNSQCTVSRNGKEVMAVPEHVAVALLLDCVEVGSLKLTGKEAGRPAARVQRMWADFEKFLGKHLPDLQPGTKKEREETHYFIDLKPDATRCHVTSVQRGLAPRRSPARRPRRRGASR